MVLSIHDGYIAASDADRARSREHPSAVTHETHKNRLYRLELFLGRTRNVFIRGTYIRDEPAKPHPTNALFDSLFLSYINRYKPEIFTQNSFWPVNGFNKF